MAPLTVSASEARANFSKLGEEIVRTGKPATVFKNSKPWLVISPVTQQPLSSDNATQAGRPADLPLTAEEQELLAWADGFTDEYRDVFEVLAK
ncbi:MAG: type II toxin-antitoxin system Phd/YefM family antitoxin [Coriobacteriales bacterium]|jgi:antitoxin (DNA-binding transcriptional repressor) of toxin-antitoxin stability system|nr:type II toxin-antitoxin system Phd/YefM family antitoxin [Coriobacteriales bacterium]